MNNICDNCGGKLKKEIEIKSYTIKCSDCKKEAEIKPNDRNLNSKNKNSVDALSIELVKNSIYNNLYPVKKGHICSNCNEENIIFIRITNVKNEHEYYNVCKSCEEVKLLDLTK